MTDSQVAMAIEEQAADWLERMDRGDWSEADQSALDAWLEEAPAHMVALWRLDGAWSFADRLAALRRPSLHETLLARGRGMLPIVAKAAAGLSGRTPGAVRLGRGAGNRGRRTGYAERRPG